MFAEQATALVEAGVDVLYIETMSAMEEMQAAVEAARQAAAGRNLPIFATFSFDHHGRTNMGVSRSRPRAPSSTGSLRPSARTAALHWR